METSQSTLKTLPSLPPSETCLTCRGCCVFTASDSPWIPYFRSEEIKQAIAAGVASDAFSAPYGARIIPVTHGDAVLCPALDPDTHRCSIYTHRPLDCQIYPFILMWDSAKQKISLTLHLYCPFVVSQTTPTGNTPPDLPEALVRKAAELTMALQTPEMIKSIFAHPGLIMEAQTDTREIATLHQLTEAITPSLTPFLPEHDVIFKEYQSHRATPSELSYNAFQTHLIWSDLLEYRWAILDNAFCLFATSHGVTHLALAPFGPGSINHATAHAFERMALMNPPHIPSRIENVDETVALLLGQEGFALERAPPDYLYRREEIVNLSGNKFHSQRAAANQAARLQPALRPFAPLDIPECLALFDQWAASPVSGSLDSLDQMMKEDARYAHHAAMRGYRELGLTARVVEVEKVIAGYSFGFPLTHDTFCVLLEVTNQSMRGLSTWLFRAFCRELHAYTFINAMDDSGLPRLSRAKALWHPVRMVPSYTVTSPYCRGNACLPTPSFLI